MDYPKTMNFRFGIDITSIPKTPAGVGNYIIHLAKSLIKLINQSNDRLFIFGRSDQKYSAEFKGADFIDCGHLTTFKRIFWEQVRLPGLIEQYEIDLFHSPNYSIPIRAKCKKVCTIHDLTCYIFPKRRKKIHGLYFRKMIKYSVKLADFIFVDSVNTQNDILSIFKTQQENIQVVYPGFNPLFNDQLKSKPKGLNQNIDLKRPYFLFISTIEPSKNVERLIMVFSEYVKRKKEFHLYLAGKPGWGYSNINKMINSPELGKNVHYIGYQSNEKLVNLYSNAFALVYPSLYEGFGIPPLEAMACGIPVICSNASSIPEVVGNAALTFDPYDEDELLQAMRTISENENIRLSLIEKGYKRTEQFSWDNSANDILNVYYKLVNKEG